jgi:uncharacterized membrane protein YjfL (UPF0719 family)
MTEFQPSYLLNAFAYAAMGILVFVIALLVVERAIPDRIRRAVLDDKNVAAAILVGLLSIGIGLIIAAAFH